MTTNLAKWAPNNGQIIKSGLSDGRRAKFLPSVAGYDYYWLRTGGYLGNVGRTKGRPEASPLRQPQAESPIGRCT